ncbi:MAG: histidine phosphatase family protein [Chitinophagaceae bacterium]|nr:MAG: histidine phosphatase family protein [Chitinophagaceae bacterium]
MKKLLIIRHAKSSWEDFTVSDFDRPLNDRGKRDAPMMADRLAARKISPDFVLTSPAKRALKTAEIFARILNVPAENILEVQSLYEAGVNAFYEAVAASPVSASTVLLFSHNPGITAFVNDLSAVKVDEMPTCAVFAVSCNITDWIDFRTAPKDYLFFDYPKA